MCNWFVQNYHERTSYLFHRSLRYKWKVFFLRRSHCTGAATHPLPLAAPIIISSKTRYKGSFRLCRNLFGLTRMTRWEKGCCSKQWVQLNTRLVARSQWLFTCFVCLFFFWEWGGGGGGGGVGFERRLGLGWGTRGPMSLRAPQPKPNLLSPQNT